MIGPTQLKMIQEKNDTSPSGDGRVMASLSEPFVEIGEARICWSAWGDRRYDVVTPRHAQSMAECSKVRVTTVLNDEWVSLDECRHSEIT